MDARIYPLLTPHLEFVSLIDQGIAATHNCEHTKAVDLFQRAAMLEPRSPIPWYNLGYVYENMSQLALAAGAYKMALKFDQKDTDARHNLIRLYQMMRRPASVKYHMRRLKQQ
jgi:Flp pilus assembly protein TadD